MSPSDLHDLPAPPPTMMCVRWCFSVLLLLAAFPAATEAQVGLTDEEVRVVVGVVVAAVVALVIIVVWVIFLCALYHIHKNKKRAIEAMKRESEQQRRKRIAMLRGETPRFQRTFLSDLANSPSMEFLDKLQERQRAATPQPMSLPPPPVATRLPSTGPSRQSHEQGGVVSGLHNGVTFQTTTVSGYPAPRSLAEFEECDVLPPPLTYAQSHASTSGQAHNTSNIQRGAAVDRNADMSELSQLRNWPQF